MTLYEGAWMGRSIASFILNSGTKLNLNVSLTPGHFNRGEIISCTHWIAGSLDLKAGPDACKFSYLCHERNYLVRAD